MKRRGFLKMVLAGIAGVFVAKAAIEPPVFAMTDATVNDLVIQTQKDLGKCQWEDLVRP